MSSAKIKMVVVGDHGVGKTSVLLASDRAKYPDDYFPDVCEYILTKDVQLNDELVTLSLFDTNGRKEYDRLRPLIYKHTDVFLMCFSVNTPDSFKNIRGKWAPEVKHFCPDTPFILIGNKKELRCSNEANHKLSIEHEKLVQQEEGKAMAKEIGAYKYLECSATTLEGIEDVYKTVAISVLEKPPKKRSCEIQ